MKLNFNPNKKYFCNGGYKFGNQIFHCWKEDGHGFIDCQKLFLCLVIVIFMTYL